MKKFYLSVLIFASAFAATANDVKNINMSSDRYEIHVNEARLAKALEIDDSNKWILPKAHDLFNEWLRNADTLNDDILEKNVNKTLKMVEPWLTQKQYAKYEQIFRNTIENRKNAEKGV